MLLQELIVNSLESSHLYVLEEWSSGREARGVEERIVKDPVAVGRVVDAGFAILEWPVEVAAVEEINQRAGVIEIRAGCRAPVFQKTLEVIDAAVESF